MFFQTHSSKKAFWIKFLLLKTKNFSILFLIKFQIKKQILMSLTIFKISQLVFKSYFRDIFAYFIQFLWQNIETRTPTSFQSHRNKFREKQNPTQRIHKGDYQHANGFFYEEKKFLCWIFQFTIQIVQFFHWFIVEKYAKQNEKWI